MRRGMESRWIDIDGPLHFAEYPGTAEGPTFVLLHGLGGSHLNWIGVAPELARFGRVLTPDLAGFGRTPLAGRSASIRANRDLLDRFLERTESVPAVIAGNSMGGAISAMQAAQRPETVAGLVLVDPALPRSRGVIPDATVAALFAAYAMPVVGEAVVRDRYRRLGPEGLVRDTLRMCMVDPGRADPALVEAHVEMARARLDMPWAAPAFLQAARSIMRALARRERWLNMLMTITCPTLLMMGRFDRLVPLPAAEAVARLRPDWDFVVYDDLGHTPQMEDPKAWLETVTGWLDRRLGRFYSTLRP
jgi:pimeloyl-ACP methyl ester carboxylesterase